MSDSFFKKIAVSGGALCLAAAVWMGVAVSRSAAFGVLLGGLWTLGNFYFFIRLVETALEGAFTGKIKTARRKITILAAIKFPVLYLAGFFIWIGGTFPGWSLLVGVGFFVLGAAWVWVRFVMYERTLKKGLS